MSKWLHWQPSDTQIMADSPETALPKPTNPSFGSFGGALSVGNSITQGKESTSASEPRKHVKLPVPEIQSRTNRNPPGMRGAKSDGTTFACPYALPEGVRLIRFERKIPPVAVTVFSVVEDPDKFIRHALGELDARLHHPVQIKAGDSTFELLSKLADCGLELHLEWPPQTQVIDDPPKSEPSKPPEPPEFPEITDEDIPF